MSSVLTAGSSLKSATVRAPSRFSTFVGLSPRRSVTATFSATMLSSLAKRAGDGEEAGLLVDLQRLVAARDLGLGLQAIEQAGRGLAQVLVELAEVDARAVALAFDPDRMGRGAADEAERQERGHRERTLNA